MALADSTYIPLDPTIFNDSGELDQLKRYVLRQLGWPLIRVEMTAEQLNDAVCDAIQLYHEYAALDYDIRVIDVPGGNIVEIPEDIRGIFISEVVFPSDYYDSVMSALATGDSLAEMGGIVSLDILGNTIADFDIAEYYMHMQQLEDFKKLVGLQKTWIIFGNTIQLYPASRTYTKIGIIYKPMLSEAEAGQIWWIKAYAVACAQLIVGRVRSKLSGFSSTGVNIAADGTEMMNNAQTEKDKLFDKLMTMGVPMPILQG